jgi:hypothetical protein
MTAHGDDNQLIKHDFSDLAADRDKWDSFITALRQSIFVPFLRTGDNNAPHWKELSRDDKDGLWSAFAALHGKTFNYPHLIPYSIDAQEKLEAPGFWCSISKDDRPIGKPKLEFEGGIHIPDIAAVGSFQILVHAMAQNFLGSRLFQSYQNGDSDFAHATQTKDLADFHVMSPDWDGLDALDERKMLDFPMPDQFEAWLALPSQRYAMQAAALVTSEIFGDAEIDPAFIKLLRAHYMGEQHDMLTHRIDEDETICDDPSNAYLEKWETRARAYVDETFRHPDDLDIERGISMARLMKMNGMACELPEIAKQKTEGNLFLRIMAISEREEALDIIYKTPKPAIKALTPLEKARLIETLGLQEDLDDVMHRHCDEAAYLLLMHEPLDEKLMAYYTAVFSQMAEEFRKHDELNGMAAAWRAGSCAPENIAFLVRLNEEVSKHMGIEPRPVFTFDHEGKEEGRYKRQAMGFASYGHGRKHLKDEYNLTLPEGFDGPLIGLNTNRSICMMNDLTPRRAAGVLVHEIGHHVDEDLQNQFRKGAIGRDHVLAPHAVKTAEWRTHGHVAENRLRSEFSPYVYKQIPSEKIAYWFTKAFEAAKPFAFSH